MAYSNSTRLRHSSDRLLEELNHIPVEQKWNEEKSKVKNQKSKVKSEMNEIRSQYHNCS